MAAAICHATFIMNIKKDEVMMTYIFQTGRQTHTPEEKRSDESSSVGVSSSCLLYQGQPQGYRAAAGPLLVSARSFISR